MSPAVSLLVCAENEYAALEYSLFQNVCSRRTYSSSSPRRGIGSHEKSEIDDVSVAYLLVSYLVQVVSGRRVCTRNKNYANMLLSRNR